MKSYIGVSGFMSRAEVDAALAAFPDCGRQLMVGVLASRKTIFGDGNSKPLRYPKLGAIRDIFGEDPRCLNLVHYAADDYDDDRAHRELCDVYSGNGYIHGLQLNGAWPRPLAIDKFRRAYFRSAGPQRVVLQIGPSRLARWSAAPIAGAASIVREVEPYKGVATDVLIDGSGGHAVAYSYGQVADLALAIAVRVPGMGVGFAGGLDAGVIAETSAERFLVAGLSCDAEGRLRDDAPGGGNLDLAKVGAYLAACGRALAAV